MDTRFPPLPKRIVVPLYPNKAKLPIRVKLNVQRLLRESIASEMNINKEDILFADSASNALYVYLSHYKKTAIGAKLKLALPAYNCPEILNAILSAGYQPVFLDIDNELSISEGAVDFTIRHECDFILWPNYFGPRIRDERILKKLAEHNINIIFDEAQSFPLMYDKILLQIKKYASVVLISFGHNKPLSGVGGGALYAKNFKPVDCNDQESFSIINLAYYQYKALAQKVMLLSPSTFNRYLINNKKYYSKLDDLLNNCPLEVHNKHVRIGFMASYYAYRNIIEMRNKYSEHLKDYEEFKKNIKRTGTELDLYLRTVLGFPSIMALSISGHQRYEIFEELSTNKIQSTWYYYPLNSIQKNKKFISQKTPNTKKISSSIIIIPFSWHHKKYLKKKVIKFFA